MHELVFTSKIDRWLLTVLIGAAAGAVFAAGALVASGQPGTWLIGAWVVLVAGVLPAWLVAGTAYTLTDTELRVRSGPFRWRVPLSEISAVTPTRNPLSSPALSLDRLRIDYGRGRWLMISPREKDAFLRELERRRPSG